ncbi:MAG: hypothetical protein ACKVK3_13220 [Acidimicrobiales bacterium]|jgi:hypothetical protein|tara:strand:+ start:67 stop:207 length:141 start_codon:yes stop_codon:yes gene_type:complete
MANIMMVITTRSGGIAAPGEREGTEKESERRNTAQRMRAIAVPEAE